MEEKRTGKQSNSLHLWISRVVSLLNEAGITLQLILAKQMEIDVTDKNFKDSVWRPAQRAVLGKESTKELNKIEDIDKVRDTLIRHFAKEFKITLPPFPRKHEEE